MADAKPDPLAPLIQQWLRSDDPDQTLEELCRLHPDTASALRARLSAAAPSKGESPKEDLSRHPDEKPTQVRGYRLHDVLGEGGMGTVYLAEQREPVRRRVALKLIKLGMDSKAIVQRFEQERQALAMMDHEGIAKVYDCGTSERGQPYFVMELVKGVPLDTYCEKQRLSLEARLQLMQQVCAAVQHAHHKGVIHRDLKPGNVLVSDLDGRLQIKIIDFGLAKAMNTRLLQESLFTEMGVVLGTPEYMAPEQADPSNLDVDTRADVYSLGVILYQLLVGQLPFSGRELREAGLLEMQRMLREVEPPKPSTRLSQPEARSTQHAEKLRVSDHFLRRTLKSDLDWVVVKALEKDRNRRYGSASALAEDLGRYLEHQPLLAGQPSAIYRLKKLIRRHRGPVLAASLVLLTMVAGGIGTFAQWRRAEQQAADNLQLAEDNARIAEEKTALATSEAAAKEEALATLKELEQVAEFQQDQFERLNVASMGIGLRDSLRALLEDRLSRREETTEVREATLTAHDEAMRGVDFTTLALDSLQQSVFEPGLDTLATRFGEQPLLQARLRQAIANALTNLGRFDQALEPQRQAVEARRRLLGDKHVTTLTSLVHQGDLSLRRGKYDEAERLLRHAIDGLQRTLGEDANLTIEANSILASVLGERGDKKTSVALLRDAVARTRRKLGEDHPWSLDLNAKLAVGLYNLDEHEEAASLARSLLELRRKALGEEDPKTLRAMSLYSQVLLELGRLEEAEGLTRRVLEATRLRLGRKHPATWHYMFQLVEIFQDSGEHREAEALLREIIDSTTSAGAEDSPDGLRPRALLGWMLVADGRVDEGSVMLERALATARRELGEGHSTTAGLLNKLSRARRAQGRQEEALSLLTAALAAHIKIYGEEHTKTLGIIHNIGYLMIEDGRFDEAEQKFRQVLEAFRRQRGLEHPRTLLAMQNLGYLLIKKGDHQRAAKVLEEAMDLHRRALGDDHQQTLQTQSNLVWALLSMGDNAECARLARNNYDLARRRFGHENRAATDALGYLAVALTRDGRSAEARAVLDEFFLSTKLPEDHKTVLYLKRLRRNASKE